MRTPVPLRVGLAWGAAALLLLTACRSHPPSCKPRPAPGPDVPVPAYYEAGGTVPAATLDELHFRARHHEIRRVLVPARTPEDLAHLSHAADPIEILLYLPRPLDTRPRPVVLMSPVLANSTLLMNEFASGFTRMGYIAAIVMRKDFDFDPETALQLAEGEFRTYAMRSKQALDWLLTREDADQDRVATFGVSAGGILNASFAAIDDRPKAHVLVLAGAPLADVLAETSEDRFRRYKDEVQELTGESTKVIKDKLRAAIRTDPLILAPRIPCENVLMFIATKDTAVPTPYQWRLWEALGRPLVHRLPLGHYTSFSMLGWISNQTNRFLASRLGTPR